ncbi:MAG TPA: hypothetical protein PL151_20435 [Phycisphaerae bacterium]|nr:hypothetical protein [Phycisphaerae bacterium]HOJ74747.1 hypothetical protein [Phycisphaerae bacterium]HOM52116.1 hypothetical protein [Phycisphaerae bacterium]HON66870.1 hypothetical protein [Phycisphaerae bacterium]HOQ87454.1 hypothetical protein [Phycisphaerae bacterium]
MRPVACCAIAYVSACAAAWASTGTLLLEYESAKGTLPAQQGWSCESHCLRTDCPSNPGPPFDPNYQDACWFQGGRKNDCTMGYGCAPDGSPASRAEHFNAPVDPPGKLGTCTYTEWLAFDDGEDYVDLPYPVALPARNLTFGGTDTLWGPHAHPAFGAPGFRRAPRGYPPLRIVTGGGVPRVQTLAAPTGTDRNLGYVRLVGRYTVPPGVTHVTLVAKLACGNRDPWYELFELWGFGYQFAMGVDGLEGSAKLGQLWWGVTNPLVGRMFPTQTVCVALARPNQKGPHAGEFFVVRLILSNTGQVQAWLNEDPATVWTTQTGSGSGNAVVINPDEQAGTMWVDYVRVLAGAIPPSVCGDSPFDLNRDGRVDGWDAMNGVDGFLDCVTGPAPAPGVFDALPERCQCHDVNSDRSIDMIDFAAFQRSLTLDAAPVRLPCDN